MSNIVEVRDILIDSVKKLHNGDVDYRLGQVVAYTVSKIIASVNTELKYYEMRNEEPSIDFIREGTSQGTKRSITIRQNQRLESRVIDQVIAQ
jgi:hypothetical protein